MMDNIGLLIIWISAEMKQKYIQWKAKIFW